MGIVRRNSIWVTIIQYAGIILGYVNTVILFPNILDTDQFGLTRILLSVTIVISQFAQLGTPSMIVRYYPYLKRRSLFYGILICAAGLLIMLSLIMIFRQPITDLYTEKSRLFVEFFYLLVPFTIAMVFYNLFDSYLKALYRNVLSASMPYIILRVVWMGLIIAYSKGAFDFETFIIAYALSYALIAIATLIYIAVLGELPDQLQFEPEDNVYLRQIGSFNSFNILSGLSAHLINKVDQLMLGSMEGLTSVSIYAIAVAMASVIRVPASAIARTAPSLVANAFKENNKTQIQDLYEKSSINQLILSAVIFLLIIINYDVLLVFLPDTYAESFMIFVMLGLAQVIDTGVGINGFIMINSKYYRVDALFSIGLLVLAVVLNLFLIPLYGTLGAALATAISILIYNVVRHFFLKQKLGFDPFSRKTLEIVILMIIAGALAFLIHPTGNVWADAVLRTALFLLISGPVIYKRNYSPELNELINMILARLRR